MSDFELSIFARLKINEEHITDVLDAFKVLTIQSRQEIGCIQYELYYGVNDINTLIFFERWKSELDFEAHKKTNHFMDCFEKVGYMIEDQEVHIMNAVS